MLLKSGADRGVLNAHNQTALEAASCPRNPCKEESRLRRVVALLDGTDGLSDVDEEQDEDRVGGLGASKGLFLPGKDSGTLSGQGKPGGGGAAKGKMAAEEGASGGGGGGGKEEDVYEFKTSSKEATPASSRGSASPGTKEEGKEGEAAKRSKEEEGDEGGEDGKQRKKRKDEGGAGRGRGVRGASIEKTVGKVGGARGRGAASADRKSPPAGRAEPPGPAPSPGKGKAGKQEAPTPPAAPAQNPEEETDSDGDKSGKGEAGPKVPPLKIVLNSGTNGREEDKKKNYIVNNGSEDGESSEGKPEGGEGGTGEGPDKAGRAERVTRSRGQQGGEEEESQQSEAAREEQARQDNEYHIKKRKLRGGAGAEDTNASNSGIIRQAGEPPTDIEKHLNIRKQIEQRRKNLFPVQPKPPQGFKDYLMNKKTYHLQGNTGKDSRIQPIPKIAPPPSLEGPLRELFLQQEDARYKLRMNHLVEKEKLVLSVEQEILRVHGRAARALANQPLPYSVCTFMRDENVYTPIDPCQEEKNRDIRSRYNGRLFLSWLQDVDDKWEKIKVGASRILTIYGYS